MSNQRSIQLPLRPQPSNDVLQLGDALVLGRDERARDVAALEHAARVQRMLGSDAVDGVPQIGAQGHVVGCERVEHVGRERGGIR